MHRTLLALLATSSLLAFASTASAHGESLRGAGGVGVNTTGGEIGEGVSLYLRYDMRSYRLFNDAQLLEFQSRGENVHQHAREHSAFLGATFGIAPRWDLSLLAQANRFEKFSDNGDASALAAQNISRTDVSQGLGDLLVLARYQLAHFGENHFAPIVGLKLPTGSVRQRTNNGEIVGTHNQPGSGSVDFQLGGAYTGEFGRLLVSADVIARVNTEGAGSFRSGNSVQADLAAGVNLGPIVPSLELNGITQERDIERDAVKANSGVTSLFLTPGVRASFGEHGVFAGYSHPLLQSFPGISNRESFRVAVGYSFSFGAAAPPPPPPTTAATSPR